MKTPLRTAVSKVRRLLCALMSVPLLVAGTASADSGGAEQTHRELRKLFLPQPWDFARVSDQIFGQESISEEWTPMAEAYVASKAGNVEGLSVSGSCKAAVCRYDLRLNGKIAAAQDVQKNFIDPLFRDAPAQYPMAAYHYAAADVSVLYIFDLRDGSPYLPQLRRQLVRRH